MADKIKKEPYSEETIKKKRRFPKRNTILICVFIAVQVIALTLALLYTPTPQDSIKDYRIVAEPRADGSLDIEYRFTWEALDESEDLTWIEIGMANENFSFYENSFSSNIVSHEKYTDGDYVSARLYLDRPYKGGETLTFSFKVCQRDMLCRDGEGYFYEFVPGWFNSTPVESYSFIWRASPEPLSYNTDQKYGNDLIWQGILPCGGYETLQVYYGADAFSNVNTVKYEKFYDDDAFNALESEKTGIIVLASFLCLILLIVEIYIIDSFVSYHRGRGFLMGYGHHVHVYGYSNPRYIKEKEKHTAHSGGRSGSGCACACACACAGGGRAGCSQKDTYEFKLKKNTDI